MFKSKHHYIIITTATDGASLDVYALGEKRMTEEEAKAYVAEHTKAWPMLFIVARSKRPVEKFMKNQLDLGSLVEQIREAAVSGSEVDLLDWGNHDDKKVIN